jgi:hypothetical protein
MEFIKESYKAKMEFMKEAKKIFEKNGDPNAVMMCALIIEDLFRMEGLEH